jgi:hypothetical protein
VALVHHAEADAREHAQEPQRADDRWEIGVAARDPPLHRPPGGRIHGHELHPLEQVVERLPGAGGSGAGGDQPRQRLVVSAPRRGDRLAAAAQLGQELVKRHVRRGHYRRVPRLEVHCLRERGGVEDGVGDRDLGAGVQAPGDPYAAVSQLAAVNPLQHGFQLVQARRPQHQAGAERDDLPPVLHRRSGGPRGIGEGVAHGDPFRVMRVWVESLLALIAA